MYGVTSSLLGYFKDTIINSKKEIQSHFASLFNAEDYPETLVFISTNVPQLYENIMQFITEL